MCLSEIVDFDCPAEGIGYKVVKSKDNVCYAEKNIDQIHML